MYITEAIMLGKRIRRLDGTSWALSWR